MRLQDRLEGESRDEIILRMMNPRQRIRALIDRDKERENTLQIDYKSYYGVRVKKYAGESNK